MKRALFSLAAVLIVTASCHSTDSGEVVFAPAAITSDVQAIRRDTMGELAANRQPRLVYGVTRVRSANLRTSLIVEVEGEYNTSAWTSPVLRLVSEPDAKQRGPLVYELIATPPAPDVIVSPMITPFRDVRRRWEGDVSLVTTVRVYAAINNCAARPGFQRRCDPSP